MSMVYDLTCVCVVLFLYCACVYVYAVLYGSLLIRLIEEVDLSKITRSIILEF